MSEKDDTPEWKRYTPPSMILSVRPGLSTEERDEEFVEMIDRATDSPSSLRYIATRLVELAECLERDPIPPLRVLSREHRPDDLVTDFLICALAEMRLDADALYYLSFESERLAEERLFGRKGTVLEGEQT